jgi:ketosteroid isomerase-like protein
MGNLEVVQEIYEAFGRGDVPAILDHLADDVGWDLDAPGYGVPIFEPGTCRGRGPAILGARQHQRPRLRDAPIRRLPLRG